jgi:hypothetical protein
MSMGIRNRVRHSGVTQADRDRPRRQDEDDPIRVLCGSMLCALRVWSEKEWTNLPNDERPLRAVKVDGLGWVGAVPEEFMN